MQNGRVPFNGRGRAPFSPCRAQENRRSVSRVDVHRHSAATGTADDDIGMLLIEFGLGDADGFVEVVVRKSRVDDLVAVLFEVGRFCAARCRGPSVAEENLHRVCVILRKVDRWLISFTSEV